MKRNVIVALLVLSMAGTPLIFWAHTQSRLNSAYRTIALQQKTITQLQINAELWKQKWAQSAARNFPR